MTFEERRQLQAFARIDGLWVAICWIGSFASYLLALRNQGMEMAFLILGIYSLWLGRRRTRMFRDIVLDGEISTMRAWYHGLSMFMYAALLFAVAQFAYFQFIDGGYLMTQVTSMYEEAQKVPEFTQMMKDNGVTPAMVDDVLQVMGSRRPIDIAMEFFTINFVLGTICSLVNALTITKKTRH